MVLAIILYLILGAYTYITTVFIVKYFISGSTEIDIKSERLSPMMIIWILTWPLILLSLLVLVFLFLIVTIIINMIKKS